jgi:diguanylate cyclase (GGDEF)-like protein
VASFKVRLVTYFLLLSLLPIGVAFWGFTSVAGTSETRRVDARLQAGLRTALAAYQERVQAAQARAGRLARDRAFQLALERRNDAALAAALRRTPGVYVVAAGGGPRIGPRPGLASTRTVTVVTRGRLVGTVVGFVRLDRPLVEQLRARSGLASPDALVLLHGPHILAATPHIAGDVSVPPGRTKTVRVNGTRYRTLVAPAVGDVPNVRFAVLSPQSLVDSANATRRDRLLIGLLISLALVSLVAWLEGRSVVRTLRSLSEAASSIARGRLSERVPVRGHDEFASLGGAFNEMADQLEARDAELAAQRVRLREAIARFGDALAATHDAEQLLPVIVESAVEATGADGARLRTPDGREVAAGDPDVPGERLELPLASADETFATLVVVSRSFDEEQKMTAGSLAAHAAIALENARLHRIVERQALVDGLTGIANQRQCEEALVSEIARADRLGTPLTLVLADLDDFKAINDVHGHAAGDEVLREFAGVLRATVREIDLAGRWGGEEFLLLLPGADAAGGARLAERVRRSLGARSFLGRQGRVVSVTCSFGVAQHRPRADMSELFEAADQALYRAKRLGKNRVEVTQASEAFSSLEPESPANPG